MTISRYKIKLEYDGSGFAGWQRQSGAISVQETIQHAIEKFTNENVKVYGAGRTDAGVHALGQIAHFDLLQVFTPNKVMDALNHFLRQSNITVLGVEIVDETFHARFSAKSRSYIYRIINRRAHLVLEKNKAWHITTSLNVEAMHTAAQYLVGNHDFSSFRSTYCQSASAKKTIDIITVRRSDNISDLIEVYVSAKSFLHNQVRIIVGTLYKIGVGKWDVYAMQEILAARSRAAAGQTAPPYGLYLYEIKY